MGPKRSKNQLRREKAKLRKVNKTVSAPVSVSKELQQDTDALSKPEAKDDDKVEPTTIKDEQTTNPTEQNNSLALQFSHIFENFNSASNLSNRNTLLISKNNASKTPEDDEDDEDTNESDSGSEEDASAKPTRKKQKLNRIEIWALKAATSRPQSVEWFDCDAPDPHLVVLLRNRLNNVDIPGHWQKKKDYLSAKRGANKAPYTLPEFIRRTGISEMRNHDVESLKKLQRDRIQPKMNKLDIDYQRLHDAFFKYQTKPRLLAFGELYSEGREKTDQNREKIAEVKPGKISRELRVAIGMPEGESVVPPWITLMQELGKPPSYEHLIIPGFDVEYNNSGYRLSEEEVLGIFNLAGDTWGHLDEGEESGPESDLEESSVDEVEEVEVDSKFDNENENENDHGDEEPEDEKPQRVEITEYSRDKKKSLPDTNDRNDEKKNSNGELYTIIKEKKVGGTNGLFNSNTAYEYPGNK